MSDKNYGLDAHCQMILDEFRENQETFEKIKTIVLEQINKSIKDNKLYIIGVEARVKMEESLAGKLALKGYKYKTLSDITDIVGARVITFYTDEVDKIAALVQSIFDIDWSNSIDKRKAHSLDSFGYMSLHYVCRIPKKLFYDPAFPKVNEYRFEIQMRTAIQHVWATLYHDSGYKSGVEIPTEYLRNLNRLAGMLELADEQFSKIRSAITDYRRQVQSLVASGNFNEVTLDGDSFRNYLQINPFQKLTTKMAAINQAEVYQDSFIPYLPALLKIGFKTLGDLEKLKADHGDDAYQLAVHQIGSTDLDIIASTLSLQNLCIAYLLKNGFGEAGLISFYDTLYGASEYNKKRAERTIEQAKQINMI